MRATRLTCLTTFSWFPFFPFFQVFWEEDTTVGCRKKKEKKARENKKADEMR